MNKLDNCMTLSEFMEEVIKKITKFNPDGIGFILAKDDELIFHQFKLNASDATACAEFLQEIAAQEQQVLRN